MKIKGLISKLIDADRKISHGDSSARIRSGWKDELGELELAFDQMIEQKQKSDDQILLLSNTLKSANDIIAIADVNFNFLFVNDAFCKTFGYKQEELTGKFVGSVILEGDDSKVGEITDPKIFMDGWKGEQWSRTKDGNKLLVEMTISPVKNLKGEVIAAVAVANDITEKKRLAKELLESKQRLEMLMKSSSTMIYSSDAFGDFDAKYISGNFSSITGYANEDFLKKGWWAKNIHPDDAQEVFKNLGELFQKGNHSYEYRFLFKDGSWHWMHDDLKLIKDDSGKPFELIGTWQDIPDRKLAEMKLKESEEKYRTLFKNIPIGIGITDLTGKLITFNDSLLEPGGYSRDDLIRIGTVENLYYNLSDRETLIPLLKEKGTITQHHIKFKRKDGSPYDALLTLSIIYINDQPMIQAVVEDITKRKQAEDSLRLFRTLLDKSNDAIEVIDMETAQFIDVNERACTDLGYSRE